jgi:hypothetical protein
MVQFKTDLEKKKLNLKKIEESIPNIDDKTKDELGNIYLDLGKKIKDFMPSRSDMEKGIVNIHRQFKLETEPTVPINSKNYKMFKEMGITPRNNKISGKEATKAFKLIGKVLNEETNVEFLRKDHGQRTMRLSRTLEEMEQDTPYR